MARPKSNGPKDSSAHLGFEAMVKCIDDDNGNGFVWHTTGSGKTLTSFKASTLATLRNTLLRGQIVASSS